MPVEASDQLVVQRGGSHFRVTQQVFLGARLGADAPEEVGDWNLAVANGWYRSPGGAVNSPNPAEAFAGQVENYNNAFITQTVHEIAQASEGDTRTYRRHRQNNSWGNWYRLRLTSAEQSSILGNYVRRSGDRLSGALTSSVKGDWVVVGNTKPGVNDSGLFSNADDTYSFGLRNDLGNLVVLLDGKNGVLHGIGATLEGLKGGGNGVVGVAADGSFFRTSFPAPPDLSGYLPLSGGTVTGPIISRGVRGAWAFGTDGTNASGLYVDGTGQPVLALRNASGAISFQATGNTGDAIAWGDITARGKIVSEGINEWAFLAKNPDVKSAGGIFAKADGSFDLLLTNSAGDTTFQVDSQAGNMLAAGFIRSLKLDGAGPSFVGADVNGTLLRWNPTSSESFAGLLRLATDAEVAARTPGLAVQPQQLGQQISAALGGYLPLSGGTVTGPIISRGVRGAWAFGTDGTNASGLYVDGTGQSVLALRDATGKISFQATGNTGDAIAWGDITARGKIVSEGINEWAFLAKNPGVESAGGIFAKADGSFDLLLTDSAGTITFQVDSQAGNMLVAGYLRSLKLSEPGPSFVGVDDNGTLLRWNPTSSESFAGLLRLATDAEVASRTPGLAVQPQQLGAALSGYLPLSGGTVTGAVFSRTGNGWVFCGESTPGVNSSGLFATGDGHYLLGLRNSAGDVTVNLDSKLGTATMRGLLTQSLLSSGTNTMTGLSGTGNGLVGVDAGGNLFRQTRSDFVLRSGDVMSGGLTSTIASGWVFNAATDPGKNDSGLYALGDGNVVLGLRNNAGQVTVDFNSSNGFGSISGVMTARAYSIYAPAGSALAANWIIDAANDRLQVYENGGGARGFHADIKRLAGGASAHIVLENQGAWNILSHGINFNALPYLP